MCIYILRRIYFRNINFFFFTILSLHEEVVFELELNNL